MSNLLAIQSDIGTSLIAAGVETMIPGKSEAFIRCAAIAIASNKDLMKADKDSMVMALIKCAKDGLVPDGKEAAIVTFSTNVAAKGQPKQWITKAQYMPMVHGVMKRARMSGEILKLGCKAIFEGDEFDYWMDEDGEHIKYRPSFTSDKVVKAFAFAKMTNGELVVEVMSKAQIDKVRAASKTGTYGPWADWYDRMACKAVFHRLARGLPNASEVLEMCEAGMNMNFDERTEKEIQPKVENPIDRLIALLDGKPMDKVLPWISGQVDAEITDVSQLNDAQAGSIVLALENAKQ